MVYGNLSGWFWISTWAKISVTKGGRRTTYRSKSCPSNFSLSQNIAISILQIKFRKNLASSWKLSFHTRNFFPPPSSFPNYPNQLKWLVLGCSTLPVCDWTPKKREKVRVPSLSTARRKPCLDYKMVCKMHDWDRGVLKSGLRASHGGPSEQKPAPIFVLVK
jgi:hypothetical protein